MLIIVTDDQRLGTMRAMRATKEIFRRDGVAYRNAFVTTPFCCPSRASIMSGLYTHNHDVETGARGEADSFDESETIQRELKGAGYRAAVFGKFLNGWTLKNSPKHFDEWAIFGEAAPDGYYGGTWNVDGTREEIEPYSTTYIRERALAFMKKGERSDDQPWFMYLAPAAAHFPYVAQPRFRHAPVGELNINPAITETDLSDKPEFVQSRTRGVALAHRVRKEQLRTLMSVDRMIAALADAMVRLGERNTVLIFTSDNGFLWGEHRLTQKRFPYVPSVRVPLYLRWPGMPSGDPTDNRLVANIDIAATIFDAVGIEPAYELDGRSLLADGSRDRLLLEFWANPNSQETDGGLPSWASNITPEMQYIEWYTDEGLLLEAEYYDLNADPWQLTNLLGDNDVTNDPDRVSLSVQLSQDRSCAGAGCP
ncbi:MAG: sulfatase [Actinomycetota bacterium]|nr:sulfatase [Actinomycetota bacterium]